MTILAEHIIGLSAIEMGGHMNGISAAQAARWRFEQIIESGELRPRGCVRDFNDDTGSQQELDILAGDGSYVFLSNGSRYRDIRDKDICFGFIFDAEALVRAGALVGRDLLADYDELADQAAAEIAATLPPSPPLSEEDLCDFAIRMEIDDPDMLEFIRQDANSIDRQLMDAIIQGDRSTPEGARALDHFLAKAADLQARERRSGSAALALLQEDGDSGHWEILVKGALRLDQALGYIVEGKIRWKKEL